MKIAVGVLVALMLLFMFTSAGSSDVLITIIAAAVLWIAAIILVRELFK